MMRHTVCHHSILPRLAEVVEREDGLRVRQVVLLQRQSHRFLNVLNTGCPM